MCVLITFVTPESFVKDCNTRTAFCPSTSVLLDHFYQGLRMADTSTRRRVKLYMLNEDRQWDDRGTGHVSSAYVERLRGISLLVRSETDGSILLESRIQTDTAYQKQQETLIVWSEADNYDLALSFQEKAGCDEIWEKICQVQGKDPSVDITQDVVDESEEERFDDMPDAAPPIELPACDLGKLEEIAELFSSVLTSPIRREKLAVAIENEGYIKKLVDLFHMCEDLENLDGLHQLFDILKSIFVLNKNALFEIMFSEDMIFDIVGILEYDPNLPQPARHRDYLKKTAKFKEVVPITNPELETKIHQTYRVQYIQDVILPTPSVLEENMLSSLSSFIFFNKVEICSMIQDDDKFLATLFQQLTDEETDDGHRKDLILFLKEFCTFSQTLQQPSRESFFKILSNLGILSAIEVILGLDDDSVKAAAIDIFSYIVEFSPSMVREFILQESQLKEDGNAGHGGHSNLKEDLLINLVIEQMVNDKDPELGGAMQLMGILRLLLDPENMMATANKTEKTEFLTFFYKHSMHVLTAPLFANTVDDRPSNDTFPTVQLLSLILELLTFCVEHHTYHIKNYVISKDLLRRVLVLLKSQHSFLALGALRFMRKIIGLKEEFYNRYIVKGNLFHPVVEAFNANGDRYNLLNSAMIELFEFVKVEDVKSLCQHIVENFNEDFAKVKYVKTFESLKLRYDQHQEHVKDKVNDSHSPVIRNSRFRRDARSLEEDEELWFEQDDEMDDSEGPAPMTDILRTTRLDADFDQINKILESKKAKDQAEVHDSPPRLFNKSAPPINIHLRPSANSPHEHGSPGSPGSPNSPGSPASPNPSPNQSPNQSPDHSPDSPSTMPGAPTPNVSPVTTATGASSATPTSSVSVVTKALPGDSASPAPKKPLVGLVDYPDEDSEEEEDEDMAPSPKKPRLGT